jgi:opacity protein-like surface antigen
MRSFLFAAVLAAAFGSAAAQTQAPASVKPLIGFGLTFGGDTLVSGSYSNGDSWKISSGGLFVFYGGAEFRVSDQFAVQGTLGYHFDRVNGDNGSVRFSRVPLDVVGLYKVNPQVRLGGGFEHVSSPKVSGSGVLGGINGEFKASTALLLEGEYMFSDKLGVKGRYVGHKFKAANGAGSVNGDHIGVLMNYYF